MGMLLSAKHITCLHHESSWFATTSCHVRWPPCPHADQDATRPAVKVAGYLDILRLLPAHHMYMQMYGTYGAACLPAFLHVIHDADPILPCPALCVNSAAV